LGYGWVGDAVYSLTFTFPHRADALRFDFSGQGLEGVADESWGLDNVQVSLTPADGSPHVRTSLGSGAVWTPATGGEVLRVRTSGNRALITFGDSRFQLIDLSDPNQPAALGTGKALLEISDAVLAGDYAYVSSWDVDFLSTVEIFDFHDPTAPILCGYYDTPGYANGLAVVGTTVYVADGDAGLLILDARNPALPVRLGEYAMPGSIDGVQATETHAYLVSGNRLILLDVTDRANPRRVGLYAAEGMISSFCVADQVAYLMLDTGKMETLDVSVPGAAKVLGATRARGQIAVSDGYAYLAMRERGLEVLAVDNPATPQWVAGASGLGSVLDVAPIGCRLLVAARSDGLQVLELQRQLYPPLPVPVISQGVMTLSWAAVEGARLQKTTSLAPANWETVPMAEHVNTVTLPSGDAAGFFRLVLDR
jgi:hypothetical protein